VRDGRFREDLYYRLHVFPLSLPPLRERREDIPLLAASFIRKFGQKLGRRPDAITTESLDQLKSYHWPGNVRELQNVIERAVITARDSRLNLTRALPNFALEGSSSRSIAPPPDAADSPEQIRTAQEMQELERANLRLALETAGWRVSGEGGAADRLGMNPSTLNSRMKA
jgi:transcriptional regulator with GAF, ATPase, and Fis domain